MSEYNIYDYVSPEVMDHALVYMFNAAWAHGFEAGVAEDAPRSETYKVVLDHFQELHNECIKAKNYEGASALWPVVKILESMVAQEEAAGR